MRITLVVETVFDVFFFHYGIALHFTEKIIRIICSARAFYETTRDTSSLHHAKTHFSFGTRIQLRTYTDKAIFLLSYLDEEAVSGKT
jgi:hypothetical protein